LSTSVNGGVNEIVQGPAANPFMPDGIRGFEQSTVNQPIYGFTLDLEH